MLTDYTPVVSSPQTNHMLVEVANINEDNSNADNYLSNLMNTRGLENILIASSISDIFVSKCTFFCCTCKVSRQRGSACNSAVSKDRSVRKERIT